MSKRKPLPNFERPKFIKYGRPVLKALRDLRGSAKPSEVHRWVSENYQIPKDEIEGITGDGRIVFAYNIDWARFYLAKSEFINSEKHGIWMLSNKKSENDFSEEWFYKFYKKYERNYARKKRTLKEGNSASFAEDENPVHPNEQEFLNHNQIRENLVTRLRTMSPLGFEKFCAFFMRSIGFEGVKETPPSRDGGIDGEGFLLTNHFVRTKMLFQCKRYGDNNAVSSKEIQQFLGACAARSIKCGVFFTTGTFTSSAKKAAAEANEISIELVDINRLLELMIEVQLGVREVKALEIEESFFEQFMPEDSEE